MYLEGDFLVPIDILCLGPAELNMQLLLLEQDERFKVSVRLSSPPD